MSYAKCRPFCLSLNVIICVRKKDGSLISVFTSGKLHRPTRLSLALRWRHNGHDGVWNHQPHHCLLNRLLGCGSKKTSKLRVTGLCARNSPGTGEFPAQIASKAENVSIWWRHHGMYVLITIFIANQLMISNWTKRWWWIQRNEPLYKNALCRIVTYIPNECRLDKFISSNFTGGNRAKLPSSRWRRRGRSLREVFACSRLFATSDLSQICNRVTRGHGTPCTKTTDAYPLSFLYNNPRKIRRETTVGEKPGRR